MCVSKRGRFGGCDGVGFGKKRLFFVERSPKVERPVIVEVHRETAESFDQEEDSEEEGRNVSAEDL